MVGILVFLHLVICFLLIIAVMIQQGKGASMGMLGGASQSFFGPAGSKTFLMKLTVGLAVGFLATSILITLVSAQRPVASGAAPAAPASAPAGGQTPR